MKKPKSQSPVPATSSKIDTQVSFYTALEALAGGKQIRREEWSDGDEFGLLKDNFLMLHKNNKFHNWIVSEGDMMALDWIII